MGLSRWFGFVLGRCGRFVTGFSMFLWVICAVLSSLWFGDRSVSVRVIGMLWRVRYVGRFLDILFQYVLGFIVIGGISEMIISWKEIWKFCGNVMEREYGFSGGVELNVLRKPILYNDGSYGRLRVNFYLNALKSFSQLYTSFDLFDFWSLQFSILIKILNK